MRRKTSKQHLGVSDYRTLLALVCDCTGVLDVESFRDALFRHLHDRFDFPLGVISFRQGDQVRIIPSREDTELGLRNRFPEVYQEQAQFVDLPPSAPLIVATRDLPTAVLREMATTQIQWPRHGIEETVAVAFETPNGNHGNLALCQAELSAERTATITHYLTELAPFLSAQMDHLLHLEELNLRNAALEEISRSQACALIVNRTGEATWMSESAQELLQPLTGGDAIPTPIRMHCAALHHAYGSGQEELLSLGQKERVPVGGRTLLVRYKLIKGNHIFPEVLVTIKDPVAEKEARFKERAGIFHLTDRERDVAWLVCDGLQNKTISDRLGISVQTVKNHLKSIFERTGAGNRTELTGVLVGPTL